MSNQNLFCITGHRLWFRETSEGPNLDVVWNPGVPGTGDHPQQGGSTFSVNASCRLCDVSRI